MSVFYRLMISFAAFTFVASAFAQTEPSYVEGELIIKVKGRTSSHTTSSFMNKIQGKGMKLKGSFPRLNVHHVALKAGLSVNQAIEDLRQDPDIEYVEPNYIVKKAEDKVGPMGAPFNHQQAVENASTSVRAFTAGVYSQSGADVKANQAWTQIPDLTANPDRPIVAIIDTGLDIDHSVFTSTQALWVNPGEVPDNGQDDDGNGYIDDVNGYNFYASSGTMVDDDGHGTHVAGIVLGATMDILDTTLPQSKIRIMPLKFLGGNGSGSTSNAIRAIYYAVDNGARVINNSWGGGNYSQALHEALIYAYSHEVSVIAAAGNAANDNDASPMYPATYDVPNIVSVAASNDWDNLASFSNYGAGTVHIAAPGVVILSTWPGDQFSYSNGTSMAAPFVAGVAALVLREAPDLTGYQVKNLLMNSAEEKTALLGKVISGRANILNSVDNAQLEIGTNAYQPSYSIEDSTNRAPASVEEEASSGGKSGGGCGLVSLIGAGGGRGGRPPTSPSVPVAIVLVLLFAPVLVVHVLRMRQSKNRRRYERFAMSSEVKLKVGDRELVGAVNTISAGGLSFNADALLEKGGVVMMTIQSPDGKEQIQVEGHVVWSEKNNAYGVEFDHVQSSVRQAIQAWTSSLVRSN